MEQKDYNLGKEKSEGNSLRPGQKDPTMPRVTKKTEKATVSMSLAQLEKMERAAAKLWPGAPLSLSAKVRSLALQRAEQVLEGENSKKK